MELPRIISVDDHVLEPGDLWERYLPSDQRDSGPHLRRSKGIFLPSTRGEWKEEQSGDWADIWTFGDYRMAVIPGFAAAGLDKSYLGEHWDPMTYDQMRAGAYDPVARLADLDANHTEASLAFPTFPRFCGQTFLEHPDRALGLACVRAYNDWMIDEWCADSEGHLIPLCLMPLWDVDLAVSEIRRNAERGAHAVCFSEIPPHLKLPSIHTGYWDPLFAVCEETRTTLCMHIGSSSKMPAASPDAPPTTETMLGFYNSMASLGDFLFSGVLVRFPELKLAYSEGQIGWIPYALERADNVWEYHAGWTRAKETIPEPPSSYYRGRVFGCFTTDLHGIESIDKVGEDNICFETDYPHTDTTWPFVREEAARITAPLTDQQRYKVLRGNAIRMLALDRI